MKHYSLLFSIPVHERLDVVVDQIFNILHFNPSSAIVLHLSQKFDYDNSPLSKQDFVSIVSQFPGVLINPESLRTNLLDIIQVHLSNFGYASSVIDFDYFCMSASNELFIRKGLSERICAYDAAVGRIDVNDHMGWYWEQAQPSLQDPSIKQMFANTGWTNIYGSQIEGTFYRKDLFLEMKTLIEAVYDYQVMPYAYARDEVYFSTIVNNKIDHGCQLAISSLYTWVPWHRGNLAVYIIDILQILLFKKNIYSVKRISREISDNTRSFIRYIGGYAKQEQDCGIWFKDRSIFNILAKEIVRVLLNNKFVKRLCRL